MNLKKTDKKICAYKYILYLQTCVCALRFAHPKWHLELQFF